MGYGTLQGINRGLKTGIGLAGSLMESNRQAQSDAERAQDREEQRAYRNRQEQRQVNADAEASAAKRDAAELADLGEQANATKGLLADFERSGKSDTPEAKAAVEQANSIYSKRRQVLLRQYGGQLREDAQRATSFNGTPADDPDGAYNAASLAYGDRAERLLSPEMGTALGVFHEAMARGDLKRATEAFGTIAQPEIGLGIGHESANGDGEIVGQTLIPQLVHHNGKVYLGVNNRVRREDGVEYQYAAPLTEDRTSKTEPKGFTPSELLDYVGMVEQLRDHLQPYEQQIKAAGAGPAGQRFDTTRQAYLALGGDLKNLDRHLEKVDLGDRIEWQDDAGNVVRTSKKGAAPEAPGVAAERKARADYLSRGGAGGAGGAGGPGGRGGSPGGKRGEYLDLVGSAIAPNEPDVNKRRKAALEYLKRDPQKAAVTLAQQLQRNQAQLGFTGEKKSLQQSLEEARAALKETFGGDAPDVAPAPGQPDEDGTMADDVGAGSGSEYDYLFGGTK